MKSIVDFINEYEQLKGNKQISYDAETVADISDILLDESNAQKAQFLPSVDKFVERWGEVSHKELDRIKENNTKS